MVSLICGIKQKVKFRETENRMVVARDSGVGAMGRYWSKDINVQ